MHEGGYRTCIMASRSHTLHIGVTANLLRRVFQHKWREHDGFTHRYNYDRLVWFERYSDVGKAIPPEKELKGWRREKKIALIQAANRFGTTGAATGSTWNAPNTLERSKAWTSQTTADPSASLCESSG